MHTENVIVMDAPQEAIFELASDITRWPELLSHYRYVQVLEDQGSGTRLVKMAARRLCIPVSWTSTQTLEPALGRILYTHVGGATRGMEVYWEFEAGESRCVVRIVHDLVAGRWWMRLPPVRAIVARVFIHAIADRTLQGIKHAAESAVHPVSR